MGRRGAGSVWLGGLWVRAGVSFGVALLLVCIVIAFVLIPASCIGLSLHDRHTVL